jgi:ribonuclease M5
MTRRGEGTSAAAERVRIREIVVVEGWHDKQAVDRALEADVWVLGGDRVARRTLAELRRASQHRGVILLTDPDGPGERIRRRVAEAVPGCKHAHLPRSKAFGRGRVGVEHADPAAIRDAVLAARPELAQHPRAALRRRRVGEMLGIGYANARSFLKKLNALGVTRAEWDAALAALASEEDGHGDPRGRGEAR